VVAGARIGVLHQELRTLAGDAALRLDSIIWAGSRSRLVDLRPDRWRRAMGGYYSGAMGHPEQFAQRTFAEETERATGGAAGWQDPPEIRLEKVQPDGFLVIREPRRLQCLAAPWPEAQPHVEVMIELKLAGNHLDRKEVARAQLRRQARELQRIEEEAVWLGEEPLWLVAPQRLGDGIRGHNYVQPAVAAICCAVAPGDVAKLASRRYFAHRLRYRTQGLAGPRRRL
jgi:hypothetical protein